MSHDKKKLPETPPQFYYQVYTDGSLRAGVPGAKLDFASWAFIVKLNGKVLHKAVGGDWVKPGGNAYIYEAMAIIEACEWCIKHVKKDQRVIFHTDFIDWVIMYGGRKQFIKSRKKAQRTVNPLMKDYYISKLQPVFSKAFSYFSIRLSYKNESECPEILQAHTLCKNYRQEVLLRFFSKVSPVKLKPVMLDGA